MLRALVLASSILASLAACSRADGGEAAAGDETRRRIVTLTPSTTEIVAAAGGLDWLVGVDRYSEYPPEVRELPRVGDFINPSFEAILRLTPDLVVLDEVQRKVDSGLRSAGIDTVVLRMHTLEDVREGLRRVSHALGTGERARDAIARIDAAVTEIEKRASEREEELSVLLVVDRQLGGLGNIVVATSGSYLDELLAITGARNALATAGPRYAKISPEAVVRAAPDVIIETTHAADPDRAARDWSELSDVPAVAHGRVHLVRETYYSAPGPRADRALRGLDELLHGDGASPTRSLDHEL
jgi:iron complex transport system substrate-binding protein